jgi:sterol desaturase/sphingolipid hydroxylase (fatty acid hydroxylase superfamily)
MTSMDKVLEIGMTYVYPILILLIVIEFFKARHLYDLKESLSSFAIAAVSSLIVTFTKVVAVGIFFLLFEYFQDFRMEYLGYSSLGWAWYVWVACIICDDFNFYWHHRWSHTVRLLWAAHIPHHNAATFNLTVSIRNGWFITLYKPIFWLWMAIIGFEPLMIGTALVINATYQFFLHSQLVPSLGWYEKIFNTPYIHVVHHSSNVQYMDRNHGGMLIIWDKIFGTYQDVIKGLKPKFGVTKPPNSYNPIKANTHEFENIWQDLKKSRSWKDRFMYVFGPPGWSHDDSSKTAKQLRKEFQMHSTNGYSSMDVQQKETVA